MIICTVNKTIQKILMQGDLFIQDSCMNTPETEKFF